MSVPNLQVNLAATLPAAAAAGRLSNAAAQVVFSFKLFVHRLHFFCALFDCKINGNVASAGRSGVLTLWPFYPHAASENSFSTSESQKAITNQPTTEIKCESEAEAPLTLYNRVMIEQTVAVCLMKYLSHNLEVRYPPQHTPSTPSSRQDLPHFFLTFIEVTAPQHKLISLSTLPPPLSKHRAEIRGHCLPRMRENCLFSALLILPRPHPPPPLSRGSRGLLLCGS